MMLTGLCCLVLVGGPTHYVVTPNLCLSCVGAVTTQSSITQFVSKIIAKNPCIRRALPITLPLLPMAQINLKTV